MSLLYTLPMKNDERRFGTRLWKHTQSVGQ